ncbi:DUF2970 domain-containing protein [Thalassotalea atypica]|uniref:DUF2970 domain-containing protein n=1 Tax=Thalassotalea atypica TaxID=2054316 RepID=UPI0025742931|nr:DUF2970 domain-containing protein [Thalassotalea atypica]
MAKYTIVNTIKSIGAAALGVQSDKNRAHDFSEGKSSHFIIGGIIGVVIFVLTLILIVSAVMPS